MGLDSLLESLKHDRALLECGVSGVSEVQPMRDAGSSCNPSEIDGVSEVSTSGASIDPATPDTSEFSMGYQPKPAPILACTPDTSETPQNGNGESKTASAWLIHFADRDPLEVWAWPPFTHAEALAMYPDAIAAAPFTGVSVAQNCEANVFERDELLALVNGIFADDTEQDRQEAVGAALVDPAGALLCYRSIAVERGLTVRSSVRSKTASQSCKSCRHLARPGLSAGYCAQRDDTPLAYGRDHPLHQLPDDNGVTCTSYQPYE